MIIGNGMLAKAFAHYETRKDVVIFASGVSNSNETCSMAFDREKGLLLDVIKSIGSERVVYFSTCSMYDHYFENNAYTNHKLRMESILLQSNVNHIIFRLPQVLGCNNKSQLMGFLYEKVKRGELFDLYDIERNLIDVEDVRQIVDYILSHNLLNNKIVNIANPNNIRVMSLVEILEKACGMKAYYNLVKKTGDFYIDISEVTPVIAHLKLFSPYYIEDKVRKYCG